MKKPWKPRNKKALKNHLLLAKSNKTKLRRPKKLILLKHNPRYHLRPSLSSHNQKNKLSSLHLRKTHHSQHKINQMSSKVPRETQFNLSSHLRFRVRKPSSTEWYRLHPTKERKRASGRTEGRLSNKRNLLLPLPLKISKLLLQSRLWIVRNLLQVSSVKPLKNPNQISPHHHYHQLLPLHLTNRSAMVLLAWRPLVVQLLQAVKSGRNGSRRSRVDRRERVSLGCKTLRWSQTLRKRHKSQFTQPSQLIWRTK